MTDQKQCIYWEDLDHVRPILFMNILLTAIGSMSAEIVINKLREINNIQITGCDIHPKEWLSNSGLVDNFYQIPKAKENPKYFVNTLKHICLLQKINYIFPLTDPEIDAINDNLDLFANFLSVLCMSSHVAIKACRDKYLLYNFFKNSKGVQTIPTYNYSEIADKVSIFPIIAKPRLGRSSEGVAYIKTIESLTSIDSKHEYVFQPIIHGDVFTVDYVRDNYGNCFSIERKELIRTSNGAGLSVEVQDNLELKKIAKNIGDSLNVSGCINIEFIFDGNKYYLMDINPRFSAGVSFSVLSGYDMVANHLKCFMNLPIDKPIKYPTGIMKKSITDIING